MERKLVLPFLPDYVGGFSRRGYFLGPMQGELEEFTSPNRSASRKMQTPDAGTEQCHLSEKTSQVGSECLDNKQGVPGNVLGSSLIDDQASEKMAKSSECLDNKQSMPSDVLTSSMIDENSNRVAENPELLDDKQSMHSDVLTASVIDEKSNQVSEKMTDGTQGLGNKKNLQGEVLTNCVIDEKSNEVSEKLIEGPEHLASRQSMHSDDALTNSVIDEKSNQVSDKMFECLEHLANKQSMHGAVLTKSVIDEKLNQVSDKMTESPECLDNRQSLHGDVLTNSVIDEKTNQVYEKMTESPERLDKKQGMHGDVLINSVIRENSNHVSRKMTESSQCLDNKQSVIDEVLTSHVIDEKSNQVSDKTTESSQCLHNTQSMPSNVLTSSVIDENSNQGSGKIIRGAVIALPAQRQRDLKKSCQTAEGSCSHRSTSEQDPSHLSNDKSEIKCEPFSQNGQNVSVEINNPVTGSLVENQMLSVPTQVNTTSANGLQDPAPASVDVKNTGLKCSKRNSTATTSMQLSCKGKKSSKLLKKKYMLRSLGSSDRALRSRTREKPKPPESNSNLVDANNDGVKNKRGKKKNKKRDGEGVIDEFSRIRARLRYLLKRVSYEQNLIDAYSSEGWKGYSLEKLKPEKELQRAKTEILRRKLKMRDLFRYLDSLCAEGRLPESVFDSEGEIDSEDIFCAKCSSKELSTNNDIILCDGACERGFHQLCVDPPLLTENIPPGDEGWLCPGCDCKDDCIELVNDSLGTRLSLEDSWERVFPEAAAVDAFNVDHNSGLPSDDSDDDDYDPDVKEDVEAEGGESSSDESEYASASEKLEDSGHEDQYMGLPSEDSEDDDYNPDAPDQDMKVAEERHGEDITSASLDDAKKFKGSSKTSKVGKKPSITDELSSLLEADPGQESYTPVSGKRNVERLDYKKLYDETYKSDTSDDDEDWNATATPTRKKNVTGKLTPVSPNRKASNNSTHTLRSDGKAEKTNNSAAKSLEGSGKSGSGEKKLRSSTYNRLGDVAIERLYKSFKENQYPDRTTKESLAQETGLTLQQVSKWFDNTRWSFRHSSHKEPRTGENALAQTTDNISENEVAPAGENRDSELFPQDVTGENSKTPSSKKRKGMSEPLASESPQNADKASSHKMKTRKRK
ncbi:Homeobox protein [Arachis hypogaea]|nr:Homeobox protein [Arachis hypogaea]